ncbi:unnamed protein product [Lupinus luteus]|uniref:Uncharacterized protein n=1 Tax=Lupinus luteus TaxID=3873 RepID=A0AAV1XNX2_LUPLU
MYEKYIIWVSKEVYLVDRIHINLVVSSSKLDHLFSNSGDSEVLKSGSYDDNIR